MSAPYCWIHSNHTSTGAKVDNKAKKPTEPICRCPLPGRLDDGDQHDDNPNHYDGWDDYRKPVGQRSRTRMINGSGFYDPKPEGNVERTCKTVTYTPFRPAPPPPPPSGDQTDTGAQGSQGMDTFQRMLTPPVSDTNSPSKKRTFEEFRVSYYGGNSKTKPNKEHTVRGYIKEIPVKNERPNPDKEVKNPFLSRRDETKQERFRDNSLPSIVENGPENDADIEIERGTSPASSDSGLPSVVETDSDDDADVERETSPASSVSGGPDGDAETQGAQSMSTFQRMLSPPMSDTNSPPTKKLDLEPVHVFMAKDPLLPGQIKNMPFKNQRPGQYVRGGPSKGTEKAAKQKPSNGPKKDARSSGNTLPASTPAASGVDSDHDIQGDSVQDTDTKDAEDLARFRKMLSPPVNDNNSPPAKQSSEDFRVFINSGNFKTKPNKCGKGQPVIRLPPVFPERPATTKEVKNPPLSAADKKKQKDKKKQAKREQEQRYCDQWLNRPSNGSSNDADKEDNGINSPVSSNTRSSSSSASRAFVTPPTTPTRPVTRSRSKQLADAAQEQATDDQYPSSASISPPPVKRKRDAGYSSQPASPVSPLSQRPLKRPRSPPGSSPLAFPNPRPTKRQRRA
jgi:hypothetical protein